MRIAILTALWKRHEIVKAWVGHYGRLAERLKELDTDLVIIGAMSPEEDPGIEDAFPTEHPFYPVHVANQPLGAKWNAAAQAAKLHKVDAVIVAGSDDLLHWEAVHKIVEHLINGADHGGILDFYAANLVTRDLIHWPGYEGEREGEPVGTGRYLSRRILDELEWQPWDSDAPRFLDSTMTAKIKQLRHVNISNATMDEAGPLLALKSPVGLDTWGHYVDRAGGNFKPREERLWLNDTFGPEIREFVDTQHAAYQFTVGAAIVCRQNEDRLERCLRSLQGQLIRDVVVLMDRREDDGRRAIDSPDDPMEFEIEGGAKASTHADYACKKHGAAVLDAEVPTYGDAIHFAEARNLAIAALPEDLTWVLIIDADEYFRDWGNIVPALHVATQSGAESVSVNVQGYTEDGPGESLQQCRIFRRATAGYKYPRHNVALHTSPCTPSTALLRSDYSRDTERRYVEGIPVLMKMYEEGDDEWKAHAAYHLSKALIPAGEFEMVAQFAAEAIKLDGDGDHRAPVWDRYVRALMELGRQEDAEKVLDEALERFPGFVDLEHAALVIQAKRYWQAALEEGGRYAHTVSRTRPYAEKMAEVAGLLNMGVRRSE